MVTSKWSFRGCCNTMSVFIAAGSADKGGAPLTLKQRTEEAMRHAKEAAHRAGESFDHGLQEAKDFGATLGNSTMKAMVETGNTVGSVVDNVTNIFT